MKLENILFDKVGSAYTLKLVDFGASRKFDPGVKLKKPIGTVAFLLMLIK